jgi:hypothetical protein
MGGSMNTSAAPRQPTKVTSERKIAKLFGLDGDNWMRHANPLSVWTRFSVLSLIAASVWSREWIGWYSLILVGLSVIWMMVNPLVFSEPRSTRNWASKGVFGERIWADRNEVTIPERFRSRIPGVANALSSVGLGVLVYGLVQLDVVATVAGIVLMHTGKPWYLDRMVLLFEEMASTNPEYARWEY